MDILAANVSPLRDRTVTKQTILVVVASLLALFVAAFAYAIILAARRLVFHPLAHFPGPKLAALTSLYEDYYEVWGNYDYVWQVRKMHARYGPVVRINPHEIHIHDPAWYSTLNSFQGKWDKDPHTAHQFANPHSSVGTISHDLHKQRKAAIQPFFAKNKIYELESVIAGKALQLCIRLNEYLDTKNAVPMRQALKCFCVDTIAEYCFAKNGNMIEEPDFALEYWSGFAKGLDAGLRARYLPKWFVPAVKGAPAWIRASIGPGIEYFEAWHRSVESAVDNIQEKVELAASEASIHRTIFLELLNNPNLSAEDKARPRLIQEGAALIGAGGETTSQVLGIIMFGLLQDHNKLKMLKQELSSLSFDTATGLPPLRHLEALPYLTACLNEGLRLRTGKIARQQRVPVGKSIFYGDIEIKPGTICSMSPVFSHVDASVFPEPHTFRPQRWIDADNDHAVEMKQYLVAYSKGTRMCTGATLANAMIYLCVAALVRNVGMEMYRTNAWDNEMAADTERHAPLKGSQGLRIKVLPNETIEES